MQKPSNPPSAPEVRVAEWTCTRPLKILLDHPSSPAAPHEMRPKTLKVAHGCQAHTWHKMLTHHTSAVIHMAKTVAKRYQNGLVIKLNPMDDGTSNQMCFL